MIGSEVAIPLTDDNPPLLYVVPLVMFVTGLKKRLADGQLRKIIQDGFSANNMVVGCIRNRDNAHAAEHRAYTTKFI